MEQIKELHQKSNVHTILRVVLVWLLILALFRLCGATNSILIWLFSIILIGVFQYHLNILGHDGLHYLISRDKVV